MGSEREREKTSMNKFLRVAFHPIQNIYNGDRFQRSKAKLCKQVKRQSRRFIISCIYIVCKIFGYEIV